MYNVFVNSYYHLIYHYSIKYKSGNKKQIYYQCLLINIIVAFSNIDSDGYRNLNTEFFGNKIIILKKVKSIRQLRRTEKELIYF
jgi:hypothetical protein